MDRPQAEIIAIQALGFIAGDARTLDAFVAQTGVQPDEIRAVATEADFLAGVLDFLLADERRVLAFCEDADLAPGIPAAARRGLPGAGIEDAAF